MAEIQRGDPVEETVLVDLLRRAQENCDQAAFEGLYLLFVDRVYRYLLARIGDAGCQAGFRPAEPRGDREDGRGE